MLTADVSNKKFSKCQLLLRVLRNLSNEQPISKAMLDVSIDGIRSHAREVRPAKLTIEAPLVTHDLILS